MPPLSLLKLVIKKMAAIRGTLYFMFLAPPPPLTILDPMLQAMVVLSESSMVTFSLENKQNLMHNHFKLCPESNQMTLHSMQVRIQDLCKGGGGKRHFADIAHPSCGGQKFGSQNWGSGGGRAPKHPPSYSRSAPATGS